MILKLQFSENGLPRGTENVEIKDVSGIYKRISKMMKSRYASQCDVFIVKIEKTEKLFTI